MFHYPIDLHYSQTTSCLSSSFRAFAFGSGERKLNSDRKASFSLLLFPIFLLSMRKRAMTTRTIASPLRKRRTDEDDATEAAMASTAATAARKTESASEPFRPE